MARSAFELPDDLAAKAQEAGVLQPERFAELLTKLLQRDAEGAEAVDYIAAFAAETEARGIPEMSEEEIQAEITASRKKAE